MKICGEDPNLLKIGQNYRTRYIEDLSKFYCCRSNEIAIKRSLLKNFLMVWGCLDCRRGINITRMHHRVTLYIQCLSCYILQMCIQLWCTHCISLYILRLLDFVVGCFVYLEELRECINWCLVIIVYVMFLFACFRASRNFRLNVMIHGFEHTLSILK
jgi:hypothetical protein